MLSSFAMLDELHLRVWDTRIWIELLSYVLIVILKESSLAPCENDAFRSMVFHVGIVSRSRNRRGATPMDVDAV